MIIGGTIVSKEMLAVPVTVSRASTAIARQASWLRSAGIVFGGSLLLAVCSHIAVPLVFTPVPLTLQAFAVLLLGLQLSPRLAAATVFAYLIEGAVGLPVFAPVRLPASHTSLDRRVAISSRTPSPLRSLRSSGVALGTGSCTQHFLRQPEASRFLPAAQRGFRYLLTPELRPSCPPRFFHFCLATC